MIRSALMASLVIAGAALAQPRLPQGTPAAVLADTKRITTTSLEGSGDAPMASLAQSGIRGFLASNREDVQRYVSMRVYAVGNENLSTIGEVVAAEFRTAKLPLPAMSLVPVLGFPEAGLKLVIEVTGVAAKSLNPNGLVYIAGLAAPTGERVAAGLERVANAAGAPPKDVVRATCFYEGGEQVEPTRQRFAATFPNAKVTFVRTRADHPAAVIECEAVGRLGAPTASSDVVRLNAPGVTANPYYSQAAVVTTPRVAYVSMTYGDSERQLAVNFGNRAAEAAAAGARITDIASVTNFWADDSARVYVRTIRGSHFNGSIPAASGILSDALKPNSLAAAIEMVVAVRP